MATVTHQEGSPLELPGVLHVCTPARHKLAVKVVDIFGNVSIDEFVKSPLTDGLVKSSSCKTRPSTDSGSPEEWGVLGVTPQCFTLLARLFLFLKPVISSPYPQ